MRIAYFGHNDCGVACLEALLAEGYEVAGVVAHPVMPGRRGAVPVAEAARNAGLPVIQPERIEDEVLMLRSWSADVFAVVGYGRMLPGAVLDAARHAAIKLHDGRLPDYRGASALEWQIINGEHEVGFSVIRLDEGIDTGDILAEERITLGPNDTAAYARGRMLELYPQMLVRVLRQLEAGTLESKAQDPIDGCTYARRRARDGVIRWRELTAARAHNLIRALTRPHSGAWTTLDGTRVIVWKSRIHVVRHVGEPGRVIRRLRDETLVACADMALAVGEVTDVYGHPVALPVGADLGRRASYSSSEASLSR